MYCYERNSIRISRSLGIFKRSVKFYMIEKIKQPVFGTFIQHGAIDKLLHIRSPLRTWNFILRGMIFQKSGPIYYLLDKNRKLFFLRIFFRFLKNRIQFFHNGNKIRYAFLRFFWKYYGFIFCTFDQILNFRIRSSCRTGSLHYLILCLGSYTARRLVYNTSKCQFVPGICNKRKKRKNVLYLFAFIKFERSDNNIRNSAMQKLGFEFQRLRIRSI